MRATLYCVSLPIVFTVQQTVLQSFARRLSIYLYAHWAIFSNLMHKFNGEPLNERARKFKDALNSNSLCANGCIMRRKQQRVLNAILIIHEPNYLLSVLPIILI